LARVVRCLWWTRETIPPTMERTSGGIQMFGLGIIGTILLILLILWLLGVL
jgi:hypothetical protein